MTHRRTIIGALALACALLACTGATGEPASAPQRVPPGSRAAFEHDNPDCAEFNDGCQMCKRTGPEVACANPPIACVQNERWRCSRRIDREAPKPPGP